MWDFQTITDTDLARARADVSFRQEMLTRSLECLLAELSKLQHAPQSPARARQVREGIELAVKLSDLLRRTTAGPRSAA